MKLRYWGPIVNARNLLAAASIIAFSSLATGCTQTTGSAPPATVAAPQVSAGDFVGTWRGESQAKRPLEMIVAPNGTIVYKFDGMDLGAGAPKFEGRKMTFSITGGTITVEKMSDTKLDWRYSGAYPASRSTLTKVAG